MSPAAARGRLTTRRVTRRGLLAAGAAALLAGCELSLRDGLRNDCLAETPVDLLHHPLLQAAWRGIAATRMIDSHCHVFGSGDSGSGLWYHPRLDEAWRPLGYLQKAAYVNAACVDESPGNTDASFVRRLLAQCGEMAPGFRVLLLGFDWARDESGAPLREMSSFYVPDAALATLAKAHPHRLAWAASIHPYDPKALERLDAAHAGGARAIKWLPSAQNIDPADPRCDRFYARLAELRLPLISHAGDERAVHGFGEQLGNPLRLRRPLDAGVRVVVAHCASLGDGIDTERGGAKRPNFELFARLMDEGAYRDHLSGDISAVTQANRMQVLAALLERSDWHPRLLNGSDYPLSGVVPLVNLHALAKQGLLAPEAVEPLRRLRESNVLLFDFVLKRSLASGGRGFATSVYETAPFFDRAA